MTQEKNVVEEVAPVLIQEEVAVVDEEVAAVQQEFAVTVEVVKAVNPAIVKEVAKEVIADETVEDSTFNSTMATINEESKEVPQRSGKLSFTINSAKIDVFSLITSQQNPTNTDEGKGRTTFMTQNVQNSSYWV